MKYFRSLLQDKFLLVAIFCMLLPSGFKLLWGQQGHIFIAHPMSEDPNFRHSVLFMVAHTIDGAKALVINRPYPDSKREKLPPYIKNLKVPIFWGGPVNDTADIIIMKLVENQKPVAKNYDDWLLDDDKILEKITSEKNTYKLFVGYAGWNALQFETERISKGWVVGIGNNNALQDVFSEHKLSGYDIWLKILKDSDFYKKPLFSKLSKA